jgi:hypothetical protein
MSMRQRVRGILFCECFIRCVLDVRILFFVLWKFSHCSRFKCVRKIHNLLIIKTNAMHYFWNLYDKSTLHVSDKSTVHHQEYLNTVYTQYVFVMLVLLASASRRQQNYRFQAESGCSILALLRSGHEKPACNLPVPNVRYKTPDDGQRRCRKYVEFYNRIKLG